MSRLLSFDSMLDRLIFLDMSGLGLLSLYSIYYFNLEAALWVELSLGETYGDRFGVVFIDLLGVVLRESVLYLND